MRKQQGTSATHKRSLNTTMVLSYEIYSKYKALLASCVGINYSF